MKLGAYNSVAGFTLTWDNVGLQQTARHQSTKCGNKYLLYALILAASNRISSRHLSDPTVIKAGDIELAKFLPSKEDKRMLGDRMEIEVQRTIKQHMPFVNTPVPKYISHEYAEEMSVTTDIVSRIRHLWLMHAY